MKTKLLAASAMAVLGAAAFIGIAGADKENDVGAVAIPSAADDFRLVDHTGFAQNLRRLVDVKAIVLVSQVNGDQGSREAAKILEGLKSQYGQDAEFLMLNSSLTDTRTTIAAEAQKLGVTFPILDDDLQLAGEQLGVTYAGETFILQPKTLKVVYHGAVSGASAALANISAGKPVAVSSFAGKGTLIAFPERAKRAEHAMISYATDVAPILEAKCVTCHQEGGIGPFAMKDYATVRGYSGMIREAVRTDTMPPWHPDPQAGAFKHDQSLSDAQIRTLVHWVEAGAPRGEGADPLAAVAHVAPEWPLGKPDLVIEAPAYTIPASGVVQYQYPTTANPLTEGRWVKAASIMPGDRKGVHHILAGYIPGTPRPGPGSASQWEANYGEYAVGGESFQVPDGLGIYLPPGGYMGFQFHYTPYGKEAVDHSKIGFYFYPKGETPEKIMRHTVIADNFIELPPNTHEHKEIAYQTFPRDALLYSIFLHTHYRGEAGSLELIKPDGTRSMVVNLPRYDFNWQRTYDLKEPLLVPAGSKLVATYLYDNSVRNAANPDPAKTVSWGDQSWEEMHYTSLYYQWLDETAAKPNDHKDELRAGRLMGMLDDNLDNKIQLTEIRGRIANTLKPQFTKLDANKDGAIDATEVQAAAGMIPGFGPTRPATPAQAPARAETP